MKEVFMDIKERIDEIVGKIQKDPSLASSFSANPVKTIESIIGIDLPDDMADGVIATVKAKLAAGDLGDLTKGFKGLF